MKQLIILIFLLTSTFGYGQSKKEIEEFKQDVLNPNLVDTAIANRFRLIIQYYSSFDIDSSKYYLNELKQFGEKSNSNYSIYLYHVVRTVLPSVCEEKQTAENTLLEFENRMESAKKLTDKKYLIKSYLNLGKLYSSFNIPSKADSFAQLGKELSISTQNWNLLAKSYSIFGNIRMNNQTDYSNSIEFLLRADSIFTTHNLVNFERFINLMELGNIFVKLQDIPKAESYYNQASVINETLQTEQNEIEINRAFAEIDILKQDYASAIKKAKKIISYKKKYGNLASVSEFYVMLSYCYFNNNQLPQAYEALDESKKIKLEMGDSLGILINTYMKAKYMYRSGKNLNTSYKLALETKNLAIKLNNVYELEYSLELLYLITAKLQKYDLAYAYKLEHQIIKDSILEQSNSLRLNEIEEKYQSEKKAQEIELLKSQNQLAHQEKKSQRNYLISFTVFALLIGLVFYLLFRNRQKTANTLKEIDKVKTRFFENISHEFRTPLTLIKLPISRALKTDESLDKQELNLMHNNTSRLQNLIEDLLSLSELDAGKMTINKSSQDPLIQTKVLSSQFDSYANSKGIEYHKSIENKALIATYDKSVVEKVMTNLISNAIKYSEKGGTVQVSVSVDNANLIMKVSDSGEGISKENQAKIFDRFYQVGEKDESKHGSGIGLALVKRVLELNNGNISLESQEGVGSTFTATLPIENISRYTNPVKQEEIPVKKENKMANLLEEVNLSDKPVLLIAEDNRELLTYISGLFRQDFEIIQAINGEEGMEKAFKLVPDIVISDWMMPKMNGIEFLTKLKTHSATSHIPFILLTAKADVEDKITGYETGADAYFSKPFNFEELKALLTNLILQRKALYEKFSDPTNEELEAPIKNSRDILFWQEIKKYIIANLKRPENLLTDKVCDTFSMSRMQLHRKLTALTGHGLGALVKNQKMNHAAKLLKDPALRISEVCFELGYNDNSAFARAFKKEMGLTPSEYKKKYAK